MGAQQQRRPGGGKHLAGVAVLTILLFWGPTVLYFARLISVAEAVVLTLMLIVADVSYIRWAQRTYWDDRP